MMTGPCVFCAIIDGTQNGYIIGENRHAIAFLDRHPITPGHTLVVPRQHSDDLFQMTPEDAGGVFALVHATARRMQDVLGADLALNVLMANGTAADQSVFHSHVHLVPRRPNDGLVFEQQPKPAATDEQLQTVGSLFTEHP